MNTLKLLSACALISLFPSVTLAASSGGASGASAGAGVSVGVGASAQGGGGAGNIGSSASGNVSSTTAGQGNLPINSTAPATSGTDANGSTRNGTPLNTTGVSGAVTNRITTNGAGLDTERPIGGNNLAGSLSNTATQTVTGTTNNIVNGVTTSGSAVARDAVVNSGANGHYSLGTFSQYDTNHDGTISQDEFSGGAFSSGDLNGDGVIDNNEWSGYSTYLATPYQTRFGDFKKLSSNGSQMTRNEFSTAISSSGYYRNFDTNNDGKISEAEYLRGINRYNLNRSGNPAVSNDLNTGISGHVGVGATVP